MTDDVVTQKIEFETQADDFIHLLKWCPPRGIRVTSSMKDIAEQPLLFSPIPFSREDIETIDEEFAKIFPERIETDLDTMVDVKLCEEGAYRKMLAEKLRFDIYHRGYKMNFVVINYFPGSKKYQTLNLRMQYPDLPPFPVDKEGVEKGFALFSTGIDVVKPFVISTCRRYGIEI